MYPKLLHKAELLHKLKEEETLEMWNSSRRICPGLDWLNRTMPPEQVSADPSLDLLLPPIPIKLDNLVPRELQVVNYTRMELQLP